MSEKGEYCRTEFEKWWVSFYETEPRESWDTLYVVDYDYYVDEQIDSQYDSWKAAWSMQL